MKFVSVLAVALLAGAPVRAESAYEALRALGKARGQEQLNHVIEVDGREGSSQPKTWKIVLDDPSARGGVREIEVKKGEIVSERTPVRDYTGAGATAAMNFQKLNLDSEGAFTIANTEAQKAGIGFDKIDYTLRVGDDTSAPVWILQLVNSAGEKVSTVRVSAENGKLLRERAVATTRKGRVTDEDYVPEERVVTRERVVVERDRRGDFPEERDLEREYARGGRDYGYADADEEDNRHGVKYHIKKAFVGAGATLEEFFTGKRTIDRNYRDE